VPAESGIERSTTATARHGIAESPRELARLPAAVRPPTGAETALAHAHEELLATEEDGIAVLTLSRPHRRNALSRTLLATLADRLAAFDASPVRAVVLEGADGCFSAGADLGELEGSEADLTMDDAVAEAARAVRRLGVPVVAALEGPCIGAAIELAAACDLRVASETAFFEIPAVRLGVLYRPGAVAELATVLPRDTLVRLLLFGERIEAAEAAAVGLVTPPVAPPGGARSAAIERAQAYAERLPHAAWPAARATKRLLASLTAETDASERRRTIDELEAERRRLAASAERVAALERKRPRRPTP